MGSGFKDWSPGDVLTAADVDGYLMRQTVMTFADASARDTALSGVLDEGMVTYLEDSNAITVYNGSAWVSLAEMNNIRAVTALNGSATVPNATFTIIPFGSGTEMVDVFGWHDTSTNNSRITPSVAGVYRLTGFFDSASGGADYIVFRAKKNGATQNGAAQYSGTNIIADTNIDVIVEANGSSDYFEVEGYQTGASSTTFACQFVMELLVAT